MSFSYFIADSNGSGNGTYYLAAGTGANIFPETGSITPSACASIKLTVALGGSLAGLTSSYTLQAMKIDLLSGLSTSVDPGLTCTVGTSARTCSVTALTPGIASGDLLQVRMDGTQAFNTWTGALYANLACQP